MTVVSDLIDVPTLTNDAVVAASQTAGMQAGKIGAILETNLEELGAMAADIAEKRSKNEISARDADDLFDLHRNSIRIALVEAKGLTTLGIEATINAVLNVFIKALNTAVGAGLKIL